MKTRKTIRKLEEQNYDCSGIGCEDDNCPGLIIKCGDSDTIKKSCDEWKAAHPRKKKNKKWHLVSEEMPEMDDDSKILIQNWRNAIYLQTVSYLKNHKESLVAWRYLPKPYKRAKDEK